MDFFTHVVIGVLTSLFLLKELPPEFILYGGIMAIFPDFDIFITPIYKIRNSYYLSHRGGSHSFVVGAIVALFMSGLFTYVYGGAFLMYWLVGFFFYGIHISCDLFTTSRIPIFYPLSKKEYRFSGERAVNPFLLLVSFLVISLFVLLDLLRVKWIVFFTLRNMFFFVYWSYLGYKFAIKTWVQIGLPENQRFIPGSLPQFYFVYEKSENENKFLTFKLYKHTILLRSKKFVLEYSIEKNSLEEEFFEKTKSLSSKYRFFRKWSSIVPIVKTNEIFISVLLLLAESYGKDSVYFLKVIYEKKTGKIISESNGFNFIKNLERDIFSI